MAERKTTRNTLIDKFLREGTLNTAQIVTAVRLEFPDAPEAAVKRQVYSRRHIVKSQTATA